MSYCKKILICLIFLTLIFSSFSLPKKANAYIQNADTCKAQGAAYHFYWMGDYCWDLFQANCVQGKGGTALAIGMFLFSTFTNGGLGVGAPFKATFFCAPIVEQCIAPELKNFEWNCKDQLLYYAPNLTVTSSWMGNNYPGLYYDDDKKTLTISVMNNGMNPAIDIEVSTVWGSTPNRDKIVSGGGTLVNGRIPMLRFRHAQQNGHDTPQQQIIDWLVSQTSVSNYFPPDPTISEIPFFWEKTIPFTAPDGQFTKVIINVDPSQMIPEMTETDNTYILEIDKLPSLHKFSIDNFNVQRKTDSLTDYTATFDLKNTGDLPGDAIIKWYEGDYADNKQPFASQNKNVNGKSTSSISQSIKVDVSNGSPSCAISKKMTLVITDSDGVQVTRIFNVPLYAGEISGRVEDSKGKPVANATVKVSTGQTTTTKDNGFYHIRGINKLGDVTLTVTHPSYTATFTKTVTFNFSTDNSSDTCYIKGLYQYVVAELRDIPLVLHLNLKSSTGQSITGKVLLSGGAGNYSYDVPGEKTIEQMEPGQYRVVGMADGYVTKEIQAVLTPPEQTIEIILEKLGGRENDQGLTLMTPIKLWEKTIETGKIDAITGSKNGKLLVVNTNDSSNRTGGLQSWTGKVTFINPVNGTVIKSVSVPFNVGQSHVALDGSYDGRTVGFTYSIPDPVEKTRFETFIKLFNASGNELGTKSMGKSVAVMSEVSPDGFFFYPHKLMNSALYTYTRQDIQGKGGTDPQGYGANEDLHFLRNNTLVSGCKNGQCVLNLAGEENRVLGQIHGVSRIIDSSFNDGTIIIRSDDKLYFYSNSSWDKEVKRDPGFTSAAISPGGEYVIVAKGPNGRNTLIVFNKSGTDVTPQFEYKNVRFVEANDRGLFFASIISNKIAYYQLGKYSSDYNPPAVTKTPGETTFSGIQEYSPDLKAFFNIPFQVSWNWMSAIRLYRTINKVEMATPWGKLILGPGTVFTRNINRNIKCDLVLAWGQAEVETNTPITMIVLKSKLYDPEKLQIVTGEFFNGTLPDDQYVTINNLHTKYKVQVENGLISINVNQGEIAATYKGTKADVKEGNKIIIDNKDQITISEVGINPLYLVIGIIIVLGTIFMEIKFRTASWLKKLNGLVKKTISTILLLIIKLFKLILSIILSILKNIFQKIKSLKKNK